MPINNITQTISTIPEAGRRGIDVQTQFVIKQEDFQDHLQGTTVTELNTLKDQLNSRIGEINSTTTTMNGYADTASAGASTATTKAGEASTSASAALTSKNQAGTFATISSASATKASQWADNNYNVAVETGKYSAKHWSTVAQNATANKIDKVTSTDNAIVRFDGTTGQVQNSSVVIDDNNNVGIGTTPSVWHTNYKAMTLHNYGSLYNGSGNYGMLMNGIFDASGSFKYSVADYATMYKQLSGTHLWFTAPSGIAGNAITWTNAMTLGSGGNLELGTSTSSEQGIKIFGGGSSNIIFKAIQSAGAFSVYSHTDSSNILRSGILSNGTYQSANNVYGSTSDIKLKENVVDSTPKLDKLMNVRVVNFNYIGQEDKQIGVIAQEIEQIFPSLVFETKDTKQVEVTKTRDITDEEGNVTQEEYTEIETQETGEVTKNVKYSIIYMMMLKGLQELNAIVKEQNAKIVDLENKLQGMANV